MITSVERLVFFFIHIVFRSRAFRCFNASCPAVRSIHVQKRGILAPIAARLGRFVFQNNKSFTILNLRKTKQFLKLNFPAISFSFLLTLKKLKNPINETSLNFLFIPTTIHFPYQSRTDHSR